MKNYREHILNIEIFTREIVHELVQGGMSAEAAVDLTVKLPYQNQDDYSEEVRKIYCLSIKRSMAVLKEAFKFANPAKLSFDDFVAYYYPKF